MSKNRYAHIDALRAGSVLLVVVAHAGLGHIVPGGSGVTVFFAISGFIITTLLLKERDRTGRFDISGFYMRRLVKLVPPLAVVLVVPTLVASTWLRIDWSAVWGQVLFFFNWQKMNHPDVLPGSGVVWSLSIEEQFYIAVALVWLWLASNRRAVAVLGVLSAAMIVGSTVTRLVLSEPGNEAVSDRIYYGSDTRADSLAWGILAAIVLYRWNQDTDRPRAQRFTGSTWALMLAVAIFALSVITRDEWFRQTFRYSAQSIAACLLMLYGFTATGTIVHRAFDSICRYRVVQIIGLSSYSIYLVHLTLLEALDEVGMPLPIHLGVGVVASLAVGVGLYFVIEVPARPLYDRWRTRKDDGGRSPAVTEGSIAPAEPPTAKGASR